ncbi:MAG: SUMF1/EgtB/PvdO family nonheme iron enzyme [Ferruginibacter sp.]|nr:SUMF1/EgtB/PvdO family nonheme iron enzyme [Ferruginibacter sp.]
MKKIILSFTALLLVAFSYANNIAVANATLSGQNVTLHTEIINFDVSWANSWRTSTNESNYDGAWIFVKFRKMGTLDWRHCTISTTGFVVASGGVITVPTDKKGAFIYKATDGIGAANYVANQLVWEYGTDGILDNETVEIRVFALEMVYIPQGSFQLGSGGTESNCFKTGATAAPYLITAATVTFGATGSNLNTNGIGPTSGTIPTAYPTGFNAFWIMKYETSQQQYVDFLNHIDLAKATFNDITFHTGTHPNFVANNAERAAYSCNTQRLAAMADWSGLRPFTEMEYEKACRGYNTPAVANEYPWGTTTIYPLTAVTNTGLLNETVSTPLNANCNIQSSYNNLTRVGLFARTTGSTRELSGGTYYGVMDMGGSEAEICINALSPTTGLAFDGSLHGDGLLDATGATNIANWVGFAKYGWRNAGYNGALAEARLSDRLTANYFTTGYGYDVQAGGNGIRLARTAP